MEANVSPNPGQFQLWIFPNSLLPTEISKTFILHKNFVLKMEANLFQLMKKLKPCLSSKIMVIKPEDSGSAYPKSKKICAQFSIQKDLWLKFCVQILLMSPREKFMLEFVRKMHKLNLVKMSQICIILVNAVKDLDLKIAPRLLRLKGPFINHVSVKEFKMKSSQKVAKNWLKTGWKLAENWPKTGWKVAEKWPKTGRKSGRKMAGKVAKEWPKRRLKN